MSEGLQIQRWSFEDDSRFSGGRTHYAMIERDDGKFCLFSDAEKLQVEIDRLRDVVSAMSGKEMVLVTEKDRLLKLLKGSATQVICVACHTMCSYDGKACTVCGGAKMIEPVRVLDHRKVKEIIEEIEGGK